MKRVLTIFVEGLVALLPLGVTIFLLFWLGGVAERTLGSGIRRVLPENWYVTGMGIAAALVIIFLAGLLVQIWGVPRLIRWGERQIGRVPLIKTVYGAMRDLLGFFSKSGGIDTNRVVVVSFGDTGIRSVGLLTRERFDDLPRGLEGPSGDPCVAVYLPYSYQVGGFTLLVPRRFVKPLDMSLEDAMRFIVTAGVQGGPAVPRSALSTATAQEQCS